MALWAGAPVGFVPRHACILACTLIPHIDRDLPWWGLRKFVRGPVLGVALGFVRVPGGICYGCVDFASGGEWLGIEPVNWPTSSVLLSYLSRGCWTREGAGTGWQGGELLANTAVTILEVPEVANS